MLNKKHARLLSFFIGSSGYLIPRPFSDYFKISKTMHPFLLGKRNVEYFYDLEKSLYGIRVTMEVLKNIIANQGKVLFISNSSTLESFFALEADLNFVKWKRSPLNKFKDADLVFLSDVNKENLVEVHRRSLLIVGIGSPTMSNISYPFNLNINSPLLCDWFLGAFFTSYLQGKYIAKKKKKSIKSLLGKGKSKK